MAVVEERRTRRLMLPLNDESGVRAGRMVRRGMRLTER